METVGYLQDQTQQKRLILTIGGCFVMTELFVFGFRYPGVLSFLLAVQIVLFFLVYKRPVWAVASLLVGQLTFSQFVFYVSGSQISGRFAWTIFALLVLISILGKEGKITLGSRGSWVIIPSLIFFTLAIIANIVNTDFVYVVEFLRQVATSLVILVTIAAVVKDMKDIKILAATALITCTISALFAVFQHYNISFLPFANTFYGANFDGGRVIGLNDSPVDLSFTMPMVILPAICVLLLKGARAKLRLPIVLAILVMCVALYFTFTRSGIYAVGAGFVIMLFFMKSKIKVELFLAIVLVCISFLIYTDMKSNRYSQGFGEEDSATGRLILWQAGSSIALDYPLLGIGNRGFKELSLAYLNSINNDGTVVASEEVIGVEQPHNDFLLVWLSFGTPALVVFVLLFIMIFLNYLHAYRKTNSRFLKGVSLGCIAGLVSYIASSATHNVMDTVVLFWIMGGLSIAVCKIASIEKPDREKVVS